MNDDFSNAIVLVFLVFFITFCTCFILYFVDVRTELILESIQQTQICTEIGKMK